MKTFLKIAAALIILLIVIGIGLNLYFTDERLKNTVMPYVEDAVGRTVQVESMSLTFFRTFPRPGLSIKNLSIPDEQEADTLLALDELVTAVELWPLLTNTVNISEMRLNRPRFTYVIYEDSTTNIDFLFSKEEETEDTTEAYKVNIPYFEVSNGRFGYRDATTNTDVLMAGTNANISLSYAEMISSTVDLEIDGLSASVDGSGYVQNLPLRLSQKSTIDLAGETVTLEEGTFSIRGLDLNLSGTISQWSENTTVSLAFDSRSDNFGDLLRLVPAEYESHIQGLETQGSLTLNGSVKGAVGNDELPAFDVFVEVIDGFLKNPELPQPIRDIQLKVNADNKLIRVESLTANAGENRIKASGELQNPLEENGAFVFNLDGNVDLSTVNQFYDISEFDIEQLGGELKVNAKGNGNKGEPEKAAFDAVVNLTNGSLKYTDVPKSIDNINIDAVANQDLVTINSLSFEAASNTFSMQGKINRPLDENNRSVDLDTDLRFDLATIKDFYPISEDTLRMSGMLTAQATLRGKADQIEQSVQSGSINLKNGLVEYHKLGKPFRDITFESVLEGNRLTVTTARFRTGENSLSASGLITDYLSDNRSINLKLQGDAKLDEIANYYDLRPTIEKLTGDANLNLTVKGSVNDPSRMAFNGNMTVKNMSMEGDSLVQPVKNLNGQLELAPQKANLKSLQFQLGASDIALNGALENYMEYLKTQDERRTTPHLTGSYTGRFLDLDELIDWDDSSSDPIPIELPDLTSSVTADISKMLVTGVTMSNLKAQANTTPKQIQLEKASVELFEGEANGSFVWEVPRPDRTMISFKGSLDSLRAESFFEEYQILGEKSKFHEHVSGSFSAEVDYYSELDVYLEPQIETTKMNGSFGMTKARIKGHPLQERLAELFKAKEFRNMALDEWKSTFTQQNSVFTFKNLRLTSGDIGLEMSGTQHMVKETIDYQMKLYLPGRFKSAIASVITEQAANALTQDNGTIMVPLRITGTHNNPKVSPDKEIISPIVKDYLKDKAGNVLKKLFGGDGN